MHYRIYGWGDDPAKTLPLLRSRGFSSVTGGYNAAAAAICKDCGLDYYISAGGFAAPTYPYVCADGTTLSNETCPLDAAMRETRLASLRTLAANTDITGITLDFCRYPSMLAGKSHFFGCFCETCMAAMTAAGYDAAYIRTNVQLLQQAVMQKTPFTGDCAALSDWTAWKQQVITAHFRMLRDAAKETNPSIRFGAFTFAPSIAPLVGQDYKALDTIVDFLSPMLYRHWRHEEGEACLDREVHGLYDMIHGDASVQAAFAACGYDAAAFPDGDYLTAQGVTVAHMAEETAKARAMVTHAALEPIYLLEDPHIAYTVDCVRPLCDAIDFFVYRDEQGINLTLR